MREKLTNRLFAKRATLLAANISRWAGETLDEPDQPMPDETLARFIGEVARATDRMWLEPVEWEPARPGPDALGAAFTAPRISVLHPGMYSGRCFACEAHMVAAKRTLHCDDCEIRRRAAVHARRTALTQGCGRDEDGGGRDG
ncbi:hypothetical protein ASG52_19705 [Methylobacterium sp. Leaf456]|uniref:hypothetical protein n=1 Tax=Methylobacterium sp. Leaf456 TaxID=1736382 RepID=UPI0006FE2147|nr:hypothetical protein [Methylobacterium sp. Leaf456]KQT59953.1 hypothetical protein ASG52_19705 [Methylobacterium sp. Leaf456]